MARNGGLRHGLVGLKGQDIGSMSPTLRRSTIPGACESHGPEPELYLNDRQFPCCSPKSPERPCCREPNSNNVPGCHWTQWRGARFLPPQRLFIPPIYVESPWSSFTVASTRNTSETQTHQPSPIQADSIILIVLALSRVFSPSVQLIQFFFLATATPATLEDGVKPWKLLPDHALRLASRWRLAKDKRMAPKLQRRPSSEASRPSASSGSLTCGPCPLYEADQVCRIGVKAYVEKVSTCRLGQTPCMFWHLSRFQSIISHAISCPRTHLLKDRQSTSMRGRKKTCFAHMCTILIPQASTYDHSMRKTEDPVRSPVLKPHIG